MPVSVELSGELFAALQDQHGGTARGAVEDAALLYLVLQNPDEIIEDIEGLVDITAGRHHEESRS